MNLLITLLLLPLAAAAGAGVGFLLGARRAFLSLGYSEQAARKRAEALTTML